MKFVIPFIIFLTGLSFACAMPSKPAKTDEDTHTRNHEPVYFGNIYGKITDNSSGKAIRNAEIYVTETAVQYLTQPCPGALNSDQGPVILPDASSAVRQASSEDDGTFIINAIPIHGSSGLYTILIEAAGYDTTVIDQVLVLPGASMALKIDCRMTSEGRVRVIKMLKGRGLVDIHYNDQK